MAGLKGEQEPRQKKNLYLGRCQRGNSLKADPVQTAA
jgi:hypothetical protein